MCYYRFGRVIMFLDNYKEMKKDFEEATKLISDYCELIMSCSRFDLDIIGNVLARIVTEIEGREFIFKESVCIAETESDSVYKRLNLLTEKTISDTSFSTETYMCNKPKRVNGRLFANPSFDDSRNIFVLNKARKLTWFDGYNSAVYYTEVKKYFKFYDEDLCFGNYGLLYKNINFANFQYLQNFIDYVIDYRIQNNMKEITEEELNEMANQFISWYKSEEKSEEFVMKLERK